MGCCCTSKTEKNRNKWLTCSVSEPQTTQSILPHLERPEDSSQLDDAVISKPTIMKCDHEFVIICAVLPHTPAGFFCVVKQQTADR